ncbi:hypothetical protein [Vibrio mexicanus]|uniref:hypothetical protein n=1 Tax=Vibrio mexicanus TaxID=1004326 RepID=UPI00063CA37F|nr:hypothetical protein [Vibrio mexicanus]
MRKAYSANVKFWLPIVITFLALIAYTGVSLVNWDLDKKGILERSIRQVSFEVTTLARQIELSLTNNQQEDIARILLTEA